jgi:hypothetical protein
VNSLALLALAAYPVFMIGLFLTLRPSRAVFISYLIAWLYLPLITIDIPGLPNYGKFSACNIVVLPCIFLFDISSLFKWRFHPADIALLFWVLVPFGSSISNGLGSWDGMSGSVSHLMLYGIPYVSGKLYLRELKEWIDLRLFLCVAALSYIPLCFYEIRMSPQLHSIVYGTGGRQHWVVGSFGWQPSVFMNSVFEIATMYAITAVILFGSRRVKMHFWVSASAFKWAFIAMTALAKKLTGIGLVAIGIGTLFLKSFWPKWILVGIPVLYMFVFVSGIWHGEGLADWVKLTSVERADSLQFRIDNDVRLVQKALERPWFGWGGWGRNRVYDDEGRDISITDSMWMITLGTTGLVGLASQTLLFLLPSASLFRQFSKNNAIESVPENTIVLASAVVLGLHLVDNLFNAFPNSIYPMLAGGLASFRFKNQGLSTHETDRDVKNTEHALNPEV